jgi:hypothetical protein
VKKYCLWRNELKTVRVMGKREKKAGSGKVFLAMAGARGSSGARKLKFRGNAASLGKLRRVNN